MKGRVFATESSHPFAAASCHHHRQCAYGYFATFHIMFLYFPLQKKLLLNALVELAENDTRRGVGGKNPPNTCASASVPSLIESKPCTLTHSLTH